MSAKTFLKYTYNAVSTACFLFLLYSVALYFAQFTPFKLPLHDSFNTFQETMGIFSIVLIAYLFLVVTVLISKKPVYTVYLYRILPYVQFFYLWPSLVINVLAAVFGSGLTVDNAWILGLFFQQFFIAINITGVVLFLFIHPFITYYLITKEGNGQLLIYYVERHLQRSKAYRNFKALRRQKKGLFLGEADVPYTEQLQFFEVPELEDAEEVSLELMENQREEVSIVNRLLKGRTEKGYTFPSLTVLDKDRDGLKAKDTKLNRQDIVLLQMLTNFLRLKGVPYAKIQTIKGPTALVYEVHMKLNNKAKLSTITGLQNDLQLALGAEQLTLQAPIPGKNAFGVQIPNPERTTVGAFDTLFACAEDEKFKKMALPVAFGRTIDGSIFYFDLADCPHLLIAGATGSGKSVGLNMLIASLLFTKHPTEVQYVMIDPKQGELAPYEDMQDVYLAEVPGVDAPIITDMEDVPAVMDALVQEMEGRYTEFRRLKSRNLDAYNEKRRKKALSIMPRIVVVVDELADLMLQVPNFDIPLARLAAKARAAGIHLVLATQRPSTDVITGTIKNNFPVRIAFTLTSMDDSRTINIKDAHKLLKKGDCIFSDAGRNTRIQGAFLGDHSIESLVAHISAIQYMNNYTLCQNDFVNKVDVLEATFTSNQTTKRKRSNAQPIGEVIDFTEDVVTIGEAPTKNIKDLPALTEEEREALSIFAKWKGISAKLLHAKGTYESEAEANRVILSLQDKGYVSAKKVGRPRTLLIDPKTFLANE